LLESRKIGYNFFKGKGSTHAKKDDLVVAAFGKDLPFLLQKGAQN